MFLKFVEEVTVRQFTDMNGHLFEEVTLGVCLVEYHGYLTWQKAAEQVRTHQPCTHRPAARRLHAEVAKRFGKCASAVKFYTAVHSPLDMFHGVDCFFEFRGVMVTIDVTINPGKNSGRADVVVQADDFENLPVLAARISGVFAEKIRRG